VLALGAGLGIGCSETADHCEYRDAGGGSVQQDILGTWCCFGIDSPVYDTFEADGGVVSVGAPGQYGAGSMTRADPEFWQMIQARRREPTASIRDVRVELKLPKRRSHKAPRGRAAPTPYPVNRIRQPRP
jgi:hypothetical protein